MLQVCFVFANGTKVSCTLQDEREQYPWLMPSFDEEEEETVAVPFTVPDGVNARASILYAFSHERQEGITLNEAVFGWIVSDFLDGPNKLTSIVKNFFQGNVHELRKSAGLAETPSYSALREHSWVLISHMARGKEDESQLFNQSKDLHQPGIWLDRSMVKDGVDALPALGLLGLSQSHLDVHPRRRKFPRPPGMSQAQLDAIQASEDMAFETETKKAHGDNLRLAVWGASERLDRDVATKQAAVENALANLGKVKNDKDRSQAATALELAKKEREDALRRHVWFDAAILVLSSALVGTETRNLMVNWDMLRMSTLIEVAHKLCGKVIDDQNLKQSMSAIRSIRTTRMQGDLRVRDWYEWFPCNSPLCPGKKVEGRHGSPYDATFALVATKRDDEHGTSVRMEDILKVPHEFDGERFVVYNKMHTQKATRVSQLSFVHVIDRAQCFRGTTENDIRVIALCGKCYNRSGSLKKMHLRHIGTDEEE